MSASDCPICQEPINKAACGRCMHKFCYECLLTWCTVHNGCPTCRQDLEFIALDPTFDAVIEELVDKGPKDSDVAAKEEGPAVPIASNIDNLTIDYRNGITSGVRIAVKSGPGVRITGVWRSGAFFAAGLRPGDVIYEINGFPCNDIRVAIDVINAAQLGCKKLTLRVHSKSASIAQKRKGSFGTTATGSLSSVLAPPANTFMRILQKAVPIGHRRPSQDRGPVGTPQPAHEEPRAPSPEAARPPRRPQRPWSAPPPDGEDQEWQWWEEEGESPPPSESYRDGQSNRHLRERLRALGRAGPDLTHPPEELPQREMEWVQTTTLDA